MTVTLEILLSAVYLAVGTALFVAAVILAVLSYHRITPRIPRTRYNNNWFPPAPINYVIPRQPPPHTSTHPYHQDPQRSTSTLASSTGETKKTFLGKWKSVFRKEAMEMLPEQDSPISSFLQTSHITRPPALPPIQSRTTPLPQTWPDTSYDSAWEQQAQQAPQQPSNLPAVVLGIPQFAQSPMTLTTSTSAPPLSSTSSGITSIFPTLPTFPSGKTQTTEPPQSPRPSYPRMSPYESSRDLPLPRSRAASQRQSSHYSGDKEGSIFQGEGGSLRDPSLRSRRSSTRRIETEDRQSVKEQRYSEESMKDIEDKGSQGPIVEERPLLHPYRQRRQHGATPPTKKASMEFSTEGAHPPRQSPRSQSWALPQPTTPDNHRAGPLPPVDR